MPRGAAAQRAEEMGVMEGLLHARRTDPRIGDWLERAAADDPAAEANLRHIRRSFERTARVPARLASELARVTSTAQGQWAEARAADDFPAFAPVLARVVALKREEAAALADGGDPYDALLDDYEPGATAAMLTDMFGALRPRLIALRDRALGATRQPAALSGTFDPDTSTVAGGVQPVPCQSHRSFASPLRLTESSIGLTRSCHRSADAFCLMQPRPRPRSRRSACLRAARASPPRPAA